MNSIQLFHTLGLAEIKQIRRDPMLRWMIFLPLVIALAARGVIPLIFERLAAALPFPLMPYYPAIMGFVLATLGPSLVGYVIGFLLLDQRDEGSLTALLVTPLSLARYLTYRLMWPMLAGVVVTAIILPLSGLVKLNGVGLVLVGVSAAANAPLYALALATFASNKVQGMALMKASSVITLPPLIAFFLPQTWQWPFALFPTYWQARFFWSVTGDGSCGGLFLVASIAYQILLLLLLFRLFYRRLHQ
jgi:fluoroquinolone transport system permease protein